MVQKFSNFDRSCSPNLQCLQTASASEGLHPLDPYRGFAPGPNWRIQAHNPLEYVGGVAWCFDPLKVSLYQFSCTTTFRVFYLNETSHKLNKATDRLEFSFPYPFMYTVSQKSVQNCFCQNFVEFLPILIIFGRKMAKRRKLCEVYSFSTSPNLRNHTTVLNADVPNCYILL